MKILRETVSSGRVATAKQIVAKINGILEEIESKYLVVGQLFLEIHQNQYFNDLGFASFNDWFDSANFGFKVRKAQYLMRIAQTAQVLNLEQSELEACGTAKLREITSLSIRNDADNIKSLIKQAPKLNYSELKEAVGEVAGRQRTVTYTVQLPGTKSLSFVKEAIERLKASWDCTSGEALVKVLEQTAKPKVRKVAAGR